MRWKLTLSYTLVTVAALLVVQLVLVGGGAFLFDWLLVRSGVLPQISQQIAAESYIPGLRPYLAATPPNQEGIDLWLRQFDARIHSDSDPLTVLVFDGAGALLATAPVQADVPAEVAQIVAAADVGTADAEQLVWRDDAAQRLWLATPIEDEGKIIGVFVQTVTLPRSSASLLGDLLPVLGISLLVVTVLAGIVGAIFGGITARGLVNRLGNLTAITDAWSHGDFSVFATDRSADELGQLARHLNRMAEQIQHLLATRQQLAVLEERNRLARDLHDSAKQQAFAVAAQLGAARALLNQNGDAAAQRLDEAERLAYDLRQELTNLVHELRPVEVEIKGLPAALHDYTQEWSQRNHIAVAIEAHPVAATPAEVEAALFRIAQEALSNVARHSRADHARIVLRQMPDHLLLQVEDNGHGFDIDTVQRGVGLDSMTERCLAIHATLQIESKVGEGTHVTVRYPKNVQAD